MPSILDYVEEKGVEKGVQQAENRFSKLMNMLLKNKRYSDAEKVTEDEKYREELYREYNL